MSRAALVLRLPVLVVSAAIVFLGCAAFLTMLSILGAAWTAYLTIRNGLQHGPASPTAYARSGIEAIEQHLAEEAQP